MLNNSAGRLRPIALRAYAVGVPVAAGALLWFWSSTWTAAARPVPAQEWALAAIFAVLVAVAVLFPLTVAPGHKLVTDDAIHFASLLLFGPLIAMLVAGAGIAAGNVALMLRGRRDPWSVLFNTGKGMLAAGLAGLPLSIWLQHPTQSALLPLGAPDEPAAASGGDVLGLLAAAAVLYVANTLPACIGIGLQHGRNPLAVWWSGRRIDLPHVAALYLVGLVTALTARHAPWAALASALPAGATYYALKRTVRLLERQLNEQALQAMQAQARLEGALLVSRRIAHDLNNALSPVAGFAELLSLRPEIARDPSSAAYVRLIAGAAEEMAATIQRLSRIVRLEEDRQLLGPEQPVLDLERSTSPLEEQVQSAKRKVQRSGPRTHAQSLGERLKMSAPLMRSAS